MKRWLVLGLLVFGGDGVANEPVDSPVGATQPSRIVYVAVKRVPQLTKLREPADYFVAKAIPAQDVPIDAVTNLEALRDQRLIKTLPEGRVIRSKDLLKDADVCLHPPYHPRIFGLSFTDCILPEKGVVPGMRVDLIFVCYAGCEVEISNVLVKEIAPVQPGEKPTDSAKPPQLLLAMTPDECQHLALMLASGKVIVRERK
jgi:hypothetical protein